MRFAGEEHAERPPVGGVVLTKITPEDEYRATRRPAGRKRNANSGMQVRLHGGLK
jgi:hypothetical protein